MQPENSSSWHGQARGDFEARGALGARATLTPLHHVGWPGSWIHGKFERLDLGHAGQPGEPGADACKGFGSCGGSLGSSGDPLGARSDNSVQ